MSLAELAVRSIVRTAVGLAIVFVTQAEAADLELSCIATETVDRKLVGERVTFTLSVAPAPHGGILSSADIASLSPAYLFSWSNIDATSIIMTRPDDTSVSVRVSRTDGEVFLMLSDKVFFGRCTKRQPIF